MALKHRHARLMDEVVRALGGAPTGIYLSRADLVAAARQIIAKVRAGRWRAAHDIAAGLHAEVLQTTEGVVLFNGSGDKVQLMSSSAVRANLEVGRLDPIVG